MLADMTRPAFLLATLLLASCSAEDERDPTPPDSPSAAAAAPVPREPVASEPQGESAAAEVLALEGLGELRIGQPVPKSSDWAERGAQIPGACRTVSSPRYPGVYAIVQDGLVRRITLGERSDVKLAEGIGIGATEAEVLSWFPFRAEPHAYVEAPGKYLTAPNAASGSPALRFEIGADATVSLIHVGTMPVLGYVEGCA
jgi:hypothetical protein